MAVQNRPLNFPLNCGARPAGQHVAEALQPESEWYALGVPYPKSDQSMLVSA
jgi:hypothetical protein